MLFNDSHVDYLGNLLLLFWSFNIVTENTS